MRRSRILAAVLFGLAALLAAAAVAQELSLRATVDRSTVRESESFTYTVRAEGQVRGEPDTRPLERDFDVLQRTSSTRIQIVNGQSSQLTEWFFQLMPKRAGQVTLPPLELGGRLTNSIQIEVMAAATADSLADIFLEVEADILEPVVQSQVIYTLRLFLGVSTGRATVTAPEVNGAIVERLDEHQYEAVRDGRSFDVRERRYAIFPQEPGPLIIGPATFEAMVIPGRGFSRMQRLRSESIELQVQRAVPPPAALAGAAWLPARRVTLSDRWSDSDAELVMGIPQTRTVVVEADGLQETQLPGLKVGQQSGIRQYPDQPELGREVTPAGLQARRVERLAVLGVTPGEVELPAVELPWWNVDRQRWEVARLPSRTLTVLPGAQPEAVPEPAPRSSGALPDGTRSGAWPLLSGGLLLAWLATLALWWRERHPVSPRRRATPRAPRRAANRRLLRELRSACDQDDDVAARRLLLDWGKLRFPDDPPRSLGSLAEKLPEGLAGEVRTLESHAYGAASEPWHGQALREALAGVDSVARTASRDRPDPLLPLYR